MRTIISVINSKESENTVVDIAKLVVSKTNEIKLPARNEGNLNGLGFFLECSNDKNVWEVVRDSRGCQVLICHKRR